MGGNGTVIGWELNSACVETGQGLVRNGTVLGWKRNRAWVETVQYLFGNGTVLGWEWYATMSLVRTVLTYRH